MSGLLAAQLALSRVLSGLVVHVRSEERWLVEGSEAGPVRELRLKAVHIDRPDVDDDIAPLNASIIERQPQVFDDRYRPRILKERWNDMSIRVLAESTCYLGVAAWFGHKAERRAYRAAIVRALLAEQLTERGGRVVIVPEYFGRPVRLMLSNAQNVDDSPQQNHWTLQLAVDAYVEEIEAIESPVTMKHIRVRPDVGVDVEP